MTPYTPEQIDRRFKEQGEAIATLLAHREDDEKRIEGLEDGMQIMIGNVREIHTIVKRLDARSQDSGFCAVHEEMRDDVKMLVGFKDRLIGSWKTLALIWGGIAVFGGVIGQFLGKVFSNPATQSAVQNITQK